jgi:hypothetical protein
MTRETLFTWVSRATVLWDRYSWPPSAPGILMSTLGTYSTHLLSIKASWGKCHSDPHFTDRKAGKARLSH